MDKVKIYHNPRWGKSRESVKILENSGLEFEIIDYINTPPTSDELQSIAKKLDLRPKDFIRSRESVFKELDLKLMLENDKILFQHMFENPKLIERPIIVKGTQAVLGRPPEKIKELLDM